MVVADVGCVVIGTLSQKPIDFGDRRTARKEAEFAKVFRYQCLRYKSEISQQKVSGTGERILRA